MFYEVDQEKLFRQPKQFKGKINERLIIPILLAQT